MVEFVTQYSRVFIAELSILNNYEQEIQIKNIPIGIYRLLFEFSMWAPQSE